MVGYSFNWPTIPSHLKWFFLVLLQNVFAPPLTTWIYLLYQVIAQNESLDEYLTVIDAYLDTVLQNHLVNLNQHMAFLIRIIYCFISFFAYIISSQAFCMNLLESFSTKKRKAINKHWCLIFVMHLLWTCLSLFFVRVIFVRFESWPFSLYLYNMYIYNKKMPLISALP